MSGCPLAPLEGAPLQDVVEDVVPVPAPARRFADVGALAVVEAVEEGTDEVASASILADPELLDVANSSYKSQGSMRWPAWLSSK